MLSIRPEANGTNLLPLDLDPKTNDAHVNCRKGGRGGRETTLESQTRNGKGEPKEERKFLCQESEKKIARSLNLSRKAKPENSEEAETTKPEKPTPKLGIGNICTQCKPPKRTISVLGVETP